MKVQCTSCKAIERVSNKICSYCRTPLPKPAAVSTIQTTGVPNNVDVILVRSGNRKIAVIKVIRDLTGLRLKEAKELVDGSESTHMVISTNIEANTAANWKWQLEKEGAVVELRSDGNLVDVPFTPPSPPRPQRLANANPNTDRTYDPNAVEPTFSNENETELDSNAGCGCIVVVVIITIAIAVFMFW